MREFLADLSRWFWAVSWWWIKTVGGAVVAVFQICYSIKYQQAPPVVSWYLLGFCLLIATFLAWREENHKIRAKSRWMILKKIVDALTSPNLTPDPILLLIRYAEDFETEKGVENICDELVARHFQDPFGLFKLKYGQRGFDGKRLKFLRDARLSNWRIASENDADNYVTTTWAEENGLSVPEPTSVASRAAAVRKAFNK